MSALTHHRSMHFFSSLIFSYLNLPSLVLTYLTRSIRICMNLRGLLLWFAETAAWSRTHKKRAPVYSRALFRVRRWVPPGINTQVYITREWMGCWLLHSRSIQFKIIGSSESESKVHLLLPYWASGGGEG
jgi:hypothetical protein